MFPPDKQPLIEKDLIDSLVPKDGNAEDVAVAVEIMDMMVERREKLFPDLRKIIVDYKCSISGGRLVLRTGLRDCAISARFAWDSFPVVENRNPASGPTQRAPSDQKTARRGRGSKPDLLAFTGHPFLGFGFVVFYSNTRPLHQYQRKRCRT